MSQGTVAFMGLLACTSLPSFGFGAETGTIRLATVVTTQQGGGTTTNTISYNARGLPSQYDIKGSGLIGISGTVNLTYNADDQIVRMESTFASLFGEQTEETYYTYETTGARRLISVQSTVSNGYTFLKQFSYSPDGRVVGMTMQGDGPDGPISAAYTVDYDDAGRIASSAHTYSAGQISDAGFYNVVYDDDGALLSHTSRQPLNEQISATYIHTQLTMTVRETMGGAEGDAGLFSEKVSTFASGPCRVPQINDGFTVEQIFNGPPGFNPDGFCRN